MFLINSGEGYARFRELACSDFYVDKTMMIDVLYQYTRHWGHYVCVTRPRGFGKSAAADMIAAFFDESTREESRALFEQCKLGSLKKEQEEIWAADPEKAEEMGLCWPVQGSRKVIRISMADLLDDTIQSCEAFYARLDAQFKEDLERMFPQVAFDSRDDIPDWLRDTGESFVFVIDDWDALWGCSFMTQEEKKQYMFFLRSLLKDRPYVDFAFMTGVRHIPHYSSGSTLNMFHDYSAFWDSCFSPYYGFTREEIQELMTRRGITSPSLEELMSWYDGYLRSGDGARMLNPLSVTRALASGRCGSYWRRIVPEHELRDLILQNKEDLLKDVIRMVGGETLSDGLAGFHAEAELFYSRDEILSAMVVYGYLSCYEDQLCIPNHEVLLQFREALLSEELD